jgi:hypothetical protein
MEKFQSWFYTLIQNDTLMLIFWVILAAPIGTWHLWYFRGEKKLSENDLVKVSRKFKEINSSYVLFSIVGLLPLMFVSLMLCISSWKNWSQLIPGIKYFPLAFALSAAYGIYQGSFALIKGVYPMAKSLSYVHDEESLIKRIAKYQILIAIAAYIIVIFSAMAS